MGLKSRILYETGLEADIKGWLQINRALETHLQLKSSYLCGLRPAEFY
jgi:hypothetical protein